MNAAEIVEILREKAIKHPIGRWADDVRIEKSVLSEAADLIEQLEMELEVTRMNLGDTRAELNQVEDDLRGAHDEVHRLMRKLNEEKTDG